MASDEAMTMMQTEMERMRSMMIAAAADNDALRAQMEADRAANVEARHQDRLPSSFHSVSSWDRWPLFWKCTL